jgi:predicted DNA-binding transcriptional regulator
MVQILELSREELPMIQYIYEPITPALEIEEFKKEIIKALEKDYLSLEQLLQISRILNQPFPH